MMYFPSSVFLLSLCVVVAPASMMLVAEAFTQQQSASSLTRPNAALYNSYLDDLSPASSPLPKKSSTVAGGTDSDMSSLLSLAAATGRGEFANAEQKEEAMMLIKTLEGRNPTPNMPTVIVPSKIQGRWTLIYSSTQLFRSSPFFMAGRAVCSTPEQAKQYDWFCDMHRKALAISTIGAVRQIISDTRMVSEFEVQAGAVPFVSSATKKVIAYSGGWPVTIDGAIVSTADLTPTADGTGWELYMDTVEIKGSNIPGLRQVLDQDFVKLPSRVLGDFLESNIASYSNPRPIFTTTYLSDDIRISRDQDDKVFVYRKEADEPTPTNYESVTPDLGITSLWDGFRTSVLGQ